ncbi:MAG: hypothetical protein K6E95_06415 [Lachnospiraceae bacterium]|nr:hypothetical protein [Lachnospiraceae bacterium]
MGISLRKSFDRLFGVVAGLFLGIILLTGCSAGNTGTTAPETAENDETLLAENRLEEPDELMHRENSAVAGEAEDLVTDEIQNTNPGNPDEIQNTNPGNPDEINETADVPKNIDTGSETADAQKNIDIGPETAEGSLPGTIDDVEGEVQVDDMSVVDITPPVFKEFRSHLVYIGDTVSYRGGVVLVDDSGEDPVLTIDSSGVNLKEVGEYPLIYTATDASGNTAVCEVSVVVREREEVTQEMLDAKADEIIEKVLGDAPRDIETLEKLFKWTKKNIGYINYFEQKDDISAAWEGLVHERGDCYVYACASKELLTRAGFKNDMIKTARHYWNLVDLGEGWYHYDTCPRAGKPYFFMWGDEQLMEYSKANGKSHDYDHTKWPDVMP